MHFRLAGSITISIACLPHKTKSPLLPYVQQHWGSTCSQYQNQPKALSLVETASQRPSQWPLSKYPSPAAVPSNDGNLRSAGVLKDQGSFNAWRSKRIHNIFNTIANKCVGFRINFLPLPYRDCLIHTTIFMWALSIFMHQGFSLCYYCNILYLTVAEAKPYFQQGFTPLNTNFSQ